jgi:hypothetical protein
MVWTRGKSASVVEKTLREDAPEAERIWVLVTARENMSVEWAGGGQLELGFRVG